MNNRKIINTDNFLMFQDMEDDELEIWIDIESDDRKIKPNPKCFYEDGFLFVEVNEDENTWRQININESQKDEEHLIIQKNGGKLVFCNMQSIAMEIKIKL